MPQLKLMWFESLFMSLEVGLILVCTSLHTPISGAKPYHKHIWEDHFCALWGKDNVFLCRVEDSDSPCLERTTLAGCWRQRAEFTERTILLQRMNIQKDGLLQCGRFAFICIQVDELIFWLSAALHPGWIQSRAYCSLPDSNFLHNYKITSLLIISPRFEVSVINLRLVSYQP